MFYYIFGKFDAWPFLWAALKFMNLASVLNENVEKKMEKRRKPNPLMMTG